MYEYAVLVILFPLIAFVLVGIFGKRLSQGGAYVVVASGRVGSRMAEGERPAAFPAEGGNVTVIQK